MRLFDAVLFDFDGTLVRVEIDFPKMKDVVLGLAREYGVYDERLQDLDILGIVESCILALDHRPNIGQELRARAERLLTDLELQAAEGAVAADGAHNVLEELERGGIRTAVVTRNCREAVEIVLARLKLPVQVLLTRNDVPRPK